MLLSKLAPLEGNFFELFDQHAAAAGFFLLSSIVMVLVAWGCRRATPSKVDRWFRRQQIVSAGANSRGHGGNDAQKTMGIISMLLAFSSSGPPRGAESYAQRANVGATAASAGPPQARPAPSGRAHCTQ